jgi:hypothetical protein
MFVCCESCVLSGRGLASSWSLVQRIPTECGMCECDLEPPIMGSPWHTGGLLRHEKTNRFTVVQNSALQQRALRGEGPTTCWRVWKVNMGLRPTVAEHCACLVTIIISVPAHRPARKWTDPSIERASISSSSVLIRPRGVCWMCVEEIRMKDLWRSVLCLSGRAAHFCFCCCLCPPPPPTHTQNLLVSRGEIQFAV